MSKKLLSIITPCYNEQHNIRAFFSSVNQFVKEMDCNIEFHFIDDGSQDATPVILHELYKENPCTVNVIIFSRNFGKESALLAGLENAKGDYVTIMDCDLQDPPELLSEMFNTIKTGEYDIISTRRINRKGEPKIRSFFSNMFYKLINSFSNITIQPGSRDYKMMNRQVVNAILELSENNRFFKGISEWVGFNETYIEFSNRQRKDGTSKWNIISLFKYAIDGIVSFSTFPLRIATIVGSMISLLAFLFLIFILVKTIIYGDPVAGYPSTISIILLVSGIQILFLGVIGEYIAKIFIESKDRPKYIIKKQYEKEI